MFGRLAWDRPRSRPTIRAIAGAAHGRPWPPGGQLPTENLKVRKRAQGQALADERAGLARDLLASRRRRDHDQAGRDRFSQSGDVGGDVLRRPGRTGPRQQFLRRLRDLRDCCQQPPGVAADDRPRGGDGEVRHARRQVTTAEPRERQQADEGLAQRHGIPARNVQIRADRIMNDRDGPARGFLAAQ
ncbi:hypothetical protein AO398_00505 [Methylobacterium sp. GXS13]|jgi:hypothetical protein|uniref:hypothetical protein n=1 Tax=Methylobacterium sp. GXS13 TaxID=1730094 RepID=UPI00071BEAFA|nr:hypothetical protein [Methylobacterium sp. GXS13]KST61206.1 hypothetical protein AO398_00505 [Methylobacterium sp. GXS13]